MPNPITPPEVTPAPTPDYGGASAEEVQQALNMYRGLNNLDTRGEYLQRVIRPEYDGQFIRQMVEPAAPAADPWAQVAPEDEPEYEYEPQAPEPFNPRSLEPVFGHYAEQTEQRIFERLGQMAQENAVKESSASAASASGLPPQVAGLIEQQVREAQRLQPNRMASDLATEAARALATSLAQWQATPSATPAPTAAVPSGPVPSTREVPKSFEDLARIRADELRR